MQHRQSEAMKINSILLVTALVQSAFGRVVEQLVQRDCQQDNGTHLLTGPADTVIGATGGSKASSSNPVHIAARYDPNIVASAQEVARYTAKGNWLGCLLEATDENAGKAWPDPLGRTPKSASSQWVGTLKSTYCGLVDHIN